MIVVLSLSSFVANFILSISYSNAINFWKLRPTEVLTNITSALVRNVRKKPVSQLHLSLIGKRLARGEILRMVKYSNLNPGLYLAISDPITTLDSKFSLSREREHNSAQIDFFCIKKKHAWIVKIRVPSCYV
jgi:hypothetical protein